MKQFHHIIPRLRAKKQTLFRYLACIVLGSYCLRIINRDCIEGFRNVKTRIYKNYFHTPDDISCYHNEDLIDDLKIVKENSLYIISTSCESSISLHRACVIESVVNSHAFVKDVYVFMTKPIKSCLCDEEIINELLALPNLHFITIQIDNFVEDTPLEDVFKGDFLKIGVRQEARVAEYLKLAVLYRFGGIVVDWDMILTESVLGFSLNWGARMNGSQFGSAIIALNKKFSIGKSLILKTMGLLKNLSDKEDVDSGLALTEAFRQLCYKDPVTGCAQFRLSEPRQFYPYNRSNNYLIFRGTTAEPPAQISSVKDSIYGYYVWERTEIYLYRGSVYVGLMRQACPRVALSYGLDFKKPRIEYKLEGQF